MAETQKRTENVCIVVVFYNPSEDQIAQVEELGESCAVVIVDNSCNKIEINNSVYIPLYENKGIAAAQNAGIEYAYKTGFDFVLLLDQDSKIDCLFVSNMLSEYSKLKCIDPKIGFLGPVIIDKESDKEYKNYIKPETNYTQVENVIASGCLISMDILKIVGGMDESLFIDLVDFEWGWRVVSKGYHGYMTKNVKLIHSIGMEYHNWNGFVLGLSSPFRYYFQYRNTLWLLRRKYIPMKWKIKAILRRALDLLLIPIASPEGIRCLKYMSKGIKNGLFQKNNPLYIAYE